MNIVDDTESASRRGGVALVSMPWASAHTPSIQLGILHAVLEEQGIPVESHSLYLRFAAQLAFAGENGLSAETYHWVAKDWRDGIGEWIFSIPPLISPDVLAQRDREFMDFLSTRGNPDAPRICAEIRKFVPQFLDEAVDRVLASRPRIVGFTTTFSQNLPSLALAARLKSADPSIVIVFGGANCEAPMGRTLFEKFPILDLVVTGEGENVFPILVKAILAGRPLPNIPSVLSRLPTSEGESLPACAVALDTLPFPNYDEYFQTLARTGVRALGVAMHLESARGCWWGARHHCTFCGLNGQTMQFRSKSPGRFLAELKATSARYGVHLIGVVDNIIDMRYMRTLLPMLADEEELDLSIHYETKANLTRAHVHKLRAAGVDKIQPGIESLSTPILREMNKGTTALQNIRLLKWCAEAGIAVFWNILYGFAGETAEQYQEMEVLCRSLLHLPAPSLIPVIINRNSPMHDRPAENGLLVEGPTQAYRYVYPDFTENQLRDIAYFFEHSYLSGKTHRDVQAYTAGLREIVEEWKTLGNQNYRALTYRMLSGTVRIEDSRVGADMSGRKRYVFKGIEAFIYCACDAGRSASSLLRDLEARFPGQCGIAEIEAFCDDLVRHRLMCKVDGRYLSLAVRDPEATLPRVRSSLQVSTATAENKLVVLDQAT